ncbi:hypothetical protein N7448_011308 [Penicillium atrosanguineum]|nr:hypothetical protein N7448_011308 [Penicillium atrosanguineum]
MDANHDAKRPLEHIPGHTGIKPQTCHIIGQRRQAGPSPSPSPLSVGARVGPGITWSELGEFRDLIVHLGAANTVKRHRVSGTEE